MSTELALLQRQLPGGVVRLEKNFCAKYAADKWFASHLPDAVVLPRNTAEVSAVMRFASEYKIPVTARGAGHGYVGGAVPVRGGIVLALERMKRIKEIHTTDFVVVVQPGVRTETLQQAVEARGLFYPPDPASRSECSIGGNIATNAGGPRCLKYGVTRDYVLGLEIVLADGTCVRVGGRTHKNKAGFDFSRLIAGSEGLLGIVTEATLKLLPLPPWRAALSVGFADVKTAARAIQEIFKAGFLPCALEAADAFTLAAARKRTGSKLLDGCNAHLIVELDGQKKSVAGEIGAVEKIVRKLKPLFVLKANGDKECEKIWQLRREFSYALRDTGLTKLNEDIVVPRGRLEDMFAFAERLSKKHDLPVACFGHAGDGNIHTNVMVDLTKPGAQARCDAALEDLFGQILAWKGSITGEHGIGLAKKKWWGQAASPELRALHQKIKSSLDPENILNPGKFI
jgi:glycolate oxidase